MKPVHLMFYFLCFQETASNCKLESLSSRSTTAYSEAHILCSEMYTPVLAGSLEHSCFFHQIAYTKMQSVLAGA